YLTCFDGSRGATRGSAAGAEANAVMASPVGFASSVQGVAAHVAGGRCGLAAEIALARVLAAEHERLAQPRVAAAEVEQRVLADADLAEAERSPEELHVEGGVGRLLEVDHAERDRP